MSFLNTEKLTFAGFIAESIQTREIRKFVDSVITEMINRWEEGNTARSIISNPAKWFVNKSFSKPEDVHQKHELLPLIKRLVSSVDPEILGQTIKAFSKATDAIHKNNPSFFSQKLMPIIRSFLKNTDFGDLRRFVDHSETDIQSMIRGLNDLLVEYPGKLITGLSFIPRFSNHFIFFLKDLTYRLNLLPADILTDILISIFKDFDGKTLGALINHVNEFIRQVHTGSALIGEAGAPQFSADLLEKLKTIQSNIDNELLLKAGNALIDGKDVLIKTFHLLLNNDQALLKVHLKHRIHSYNSKITALKEKLEMIDEFSEDDDSELLTSIISEINVFDIAETLNASFCILNALQGNAPQTLQKIISELMTTLDRDEIESLLETIFLENNSSLRPFVRTTFPIIVNGFMACLSPENDDNDEKINNARNKLRTFLMDKEV
jgi:hypothetical protein